MSAKDRLATNNRKILLSEPLPAFGSRQALDILSGLGEVVIASRANEEALTKETRDADALVVRFARITRPIIHNAETLRVIGRTGTGVDNIDVQAATERKILVVNVPAVNTVSVVEHTFSLILALCKKLKEADETLRSMGWAERERIASEIVDLKEKTLGIIGLGSIGREVARIGKAFKMRVIGYDPYLDAEKARETGVELTDLRSIMSRSDIVTIHCALTEQTHHLINEQTLGLMKTSSYLVNCSRGPIVDEEALVRALRERRIAGAACDVFEKEPVDLANPLLKLPNAILTPHVAGFTRETIEKTLVMLAEDISRAIRGEKPVNLVNPEALTA